RWVRMAIEVYPQSHFGREIWQVVLEEFLLAALDDPRVLLRYDMVGNRLDRAIDPPSAVCFDEAGGGRERKRRHPGGPSLARADEAMPSLTDPSAKTDTAPFRGLIQKVGAEEGWKKAVKTAHQEPVPFDEPTLGIVGMWRMGAGANPHFALALGEIMLRVGQ